MPWLRRVSQECAVLGILESISLNLHKPRAARCQRAPNAVKNSCNVRQVRQSVQVPEVGAGCGGVGMGGCALCGY